MIPSTALMFSVRRLVPASLQILASRAAIWVTGWANNLRMMLRVKQLLAKLQEVEEHYELFLKGAECGVWKWEAATGKLFISNQFRKIMGWPEETVPATGESFLRLVHPKDAPGLSAALEACISGDQDNSDMEYRIRGSYGQYHWLRGKAVTKRDDAGKLLLLAGSATDITARVHAEAELRRHRLRLEKKVEAQIQRIQNSEARLAAAVNAISDGFCLFDNTQSVVMVNDRMRALHRNIQPETKPGDSIEDVAIQIYRHAKSEAEQKNWLQCFERLKQGVADDEIERGDGTWLKISRARIPNGDTIILHSDITRYKQQEAALQAQAAELQSALEKEKELNHTHRQFVFMASHEFRTPLAIIDGSTQLLSSNPDGITAEKVLKRCEKIRNAVSRMTSLIDSTLTAARLDAGMVEVTPGPCDLRGLVSEVCESHREIAAGRRILCNLAELPDQIMGDRSALERVLINLVSNAIKYSPVNCEVFVHGRRGGDNALITITDQGVGIAEEDLPRMFSRFFRAQTSVGTAGTGLGLCVAQELVTLHGGKITVESVEGQGSAFTVTLPIAGPAASSNADA